MQTVAQRTLVRRNKDDGGISQAGMKTSVKAVSVLENMMFEERKDPACGGFTAADCKD